MKTIDEVIKQFDNVPFGNSEFQIENFLEKLTPERQYRNCLLQINQKISALKKAEFEHKRKIVKIKQLKEEIKESAGYLQDELKIDLEEKEFELASVDTLIKDAAIEVKIYLEQLEKLPEFTREQFENAEIGYWRKGLSIEAANQYASSKRIEAGTIDALNNIGMAIVRDKKNNIVIIEKDKLKQINQNNEVK